MMKVFIFSFLFLFLSFHCHRVSSQEHASTPPRGWNSYDSFCWTVSEKEFLANADAVAKHLLPHGYEYAVVDYLWYRKKVPGAYVDSLGYDVIDKWGRPIPDPGRWPSSRHGQGFTDVASKVHKMGLKFGIHLMRGISTQAVNANTPILDVTTGTAYKESGKTWTSKDIAITAQRCAWMQNGFMNVNTTLGAGKAFLKSLYVQYGEWGVDFVKNDCVFGEDIDVGEITVVSEVLKQFDHPVLYSLSPGTQVTPSLAKGITDIVNMYRITGDDWDTWYDVATHFDVSRDLAAANLIGADGLLGKSWPDLDMLPLGWLTDPGSNSGPHRQTRLTLDEQRTQMTLWFIAKSPLMFGGDVRKLDDITTALLTNPTVLEINSFSSNNKEFPLISGNPSKEDINNDDLANTWQSRRQLKSLKTSDSEVLHLTNCADEKAIGWSTKVRDQDRDNICWKEHSRKKYQKSFCFNKRESLSASDDDVTHKQQYQGKVRLYASDKENMCLHGSPKRKRCLFSPCRWDENQMWELNANGTLANSYSGLCATVDSVNGIGVAVPVGVRGWIATGRTGEIYVAFFNLNSLKTTITAKTSDLAKELPGSKLGAGPCKASEVWSDQELGNIVQDISFAVDSHGTALFVLQCGL